MLFGHVALAILAQRRFNTDVETTLAGALFPDVVDKGLCQGLHITPSGRMWAHTLLSLGLTTLLVRIIRGKSTARSWGIGYISHLMGDAADPVPWLFPFTSYEFRPSRGFWENIRNHLHNPGKMGLEILLVIWALHVSLRG